LSLLSMATITLQYLHAVNINLGLDAVALFAANNNGDVGADQYEVIELQMSHRVTVVKFVV